MEKKVITFRQEKTSGEVIAPISPMAFDLINKYSGSLPKALVNQKTNQYLKDIGKWAGIDSLIVVTHKSGSKVTTERLPKYELISTHTARRSYCTNAYLAGWPVMAIMKVSGHKTESAFRSYIRVDNEQNANQLLEMMWSKEEKNIF